MARHLITKTLLAAGALTVLAAAPSAMAAPEKPIKQKTKKSQNYTKVASDKSHKHKGDKHRHRQSDRSRNYRRNNHYRSRTRSYRNRNTYGDYYSPFRRISSLSYGNRGYYSPYRSNIGISFNFGSPGYSRYRWSHSPYSFYRSSYGSYGYYQTSTTCRRITVEGWHHGHRELVSVKQCSNPWDGTYIVQGSERVIDCRW